MKKSTYLLPGAALAFLFVCTFLFHDARAQCTSYFHSVYNATTDEVDFTPMCTYDTTIHPIIYQWEFGDGTTEYGENPSHHYSTGNTYLVCLILWVGNTAGCCQDTFCEQIDFVPASIPKNHDWISGVAVNSCNENIKLYLTLKQPQSLSISLVTITGRVFPVHVSQSIPLGRNEIDFSMPDYPPGIYLLRIEDQAGNSVSRRFMLY